MVTIRNIEKTTVYFLFSLFIQFSTIEIRLVFPQTKFMISWLQWLEKKLGCPCSLVRYSHFSTDRAQYPGESAMFCTSTRSCARADDAKIVRSRDAQCNTEELHYMKNISVHYRVPYMKYLPMVLRSHAVWTKLLRVYTEHFKMSVFLYSFHRGLYCLNLDDCLVENGRQLKKIASDCCGVGFKDS